MHTCSLSLTHIHTHSHTSDTHTHTNTEFTQRPVQAVLKEHADSKNALDLPQIPKGKSMPLPTAKRFCLTADNFQVSLSLCLSRACSPSTTATFFLGLALSPSRFVSLSHSLSLSLVPNCQALLSDRRRQGDRETERQRDRETERQADLVTR